MPCGTFGPNVKLRCLLCSVRIVKYRLISHAFFLLISSSVGGYAVLYRADNSRCHATSWSKMRIMASLYSSSGMPMLRRVFTNRIAWRMEEVTPNIVTSSSTNGGYPLCSHCVV